MYTWEEYAGNQIII